MKLYPVLSIAVLVVLYFIGRFIQQEYIRSKQKKKCREIVSEHLDREMRLQNLPFESWHPSFVDRRLCVFIFFTRPLSPEEHEMIPVHFIGFPVLSDAR